MQLFSTTGIRGEANKKMSPQFCLKCGLVFGSMINNTILVGHDTRLSALMVESAVISGLLSKGCNVIKAGLVPTPAMHLWIKNHSVFGGIVITCSHNPPEDIGLKFIIEDGSELAGDEETEFENLFSKEEMPLAKWDKIGSVSEESSVSQYYCEQIISDIGKLTKPLHIVVDPGNGAQSETLPFILEKIGAKVTSINNTFDPFFSGRGAEPNESTVSSLQEKVLECSADLGVATDGDGDRCVFVDNKGQYVMGDIVGALFAKEYCENKPVVTSVASSSVISHVSKKVEWTPVGAAFIVKTMRETNAPFGFEENGGFIFPHFNLARDGAYAAAKMCQILAKSTKSFSELVNEFPHFYQKKEKISCNNKEDVMASVKEFYKNEECITTDGVKVIFDEGAILVRPSGTEPFIRVYGECTSQSVLFMKMKPILNHINTIVKN